jgi:tetrahydromethanopterin S-methyltransferase subunit G
MWGFLFGIIIGVIIMLFRPDIVTSFMSCVL